MRIPIVEVIGGSTVRFTFASPGDTFSPLACALYDGAETLVSSTAAVSSGNGYYYALLVVPTSYPWYVNHWVGVSAASTYIARQLVRMHRLEVDQ